MSGSHRIKILAFLFAFGTCIAPASSRAQQALSPAGISTLVRQAVQYQLADFQHTGWGLQYRVHRVDSKEDGIREVMETTDGIVSRTLTYKGRPLTPEETAGEQARLRALTPEEVRRRRQKADSNDKYGIELIRTFPQSMTFTLTPGQPQLPAGPHAQIVLDYAPNPAFHPDGTVQTLLTGIAGRIWLDADNHHLIRIEIHLVKTLNLMFGVLARIYEGGKLSYDQAPVGGGHYAYTRIEMDVKLRELMLHVAPYHQLLTTSDVRYLGTPPTVQDAVRTLLSVPSIPQ